MGLTLADARGVARCRRVCGERRFGGSTAHWRTEGAVPAGFMGGVGSAAGFSEATTPIRRAAGDDRPSGRGTESRRRCSRLLPNAAG